MLLVDDLAAGGTKNLRHTPRGLVTLMYKLQIVNICGHTARIMIGVSKVQDFRNFELSPMLT